jgi:hypothetical protein
MAAQRNKLRLGELLVEIGILSQDQLVYALIDQRHGSERIGETLLRLGFLERRQLVAALAEQHFRRFVGALGITMLALSPGLAAAGNLRSQMQVSATVASAATTNTSMAGAAAAGTGAAAISLTCNPAQTVRIDIEHSGFAPQLAGTATAPTPYVVTWRSDHGGTVACGTVPQPGIAPTELAADRSAAAARGLPSLNVVVSY